MKIIKIAKVIFESFVVIAKKETIKKRSINSLFLKLLSISNKNK